MTKLNVLLLAGSTRKESWNKKLIRLATRELGRQKVATTLIDLKDYPLPLYDGDLEAQEGLPANALELKKIFFAHQGLVIASPEYNGGISGVLKNTIDWVSRPDIPESDRQYFAGKVALLLSASTGRLGGLRGLDQLRAVLAKLKVIVLPEQLNIGPAEKKFAPPGVLDARDSFSDPRDQERLEHLIKIFVDTAGRLTS